MSNRVILALAALGLSIASPCASQVTPVPQNLIRQLRASDWQQRQSAFTPIQATPRVWGRPGMPAALVELLRREEEVIASTLQKSNGRLGVSDVYGEGFGEYESDVFDACLEYCDRQSLLSVMLDQVRIPDVRRDAVELLGTIYYGHGFTLRQHAVIDSTLIAAASDPSSFLTRQSALGALGAVIRRNGELPAGDRVRIHTAVVQAAADKYADVCLAAIRRLVEVADPADLGLLRRLSQQDTARIVTKGKMVYPVREAALQAISKLSPK